MIDSNGDQVGVIPIENALELAETRELDLIEIVPKAKPPVCKIIDYGKYRYELQKKLKEARKKQSHVGGVKEIRLRPKINEHDYQFKVKHARNFLEHGYKVKFTIMFRGREIERKEFAKTLAQKLIDDLEDIGKIEGKVKFEGMNMVLIFTTR